MDRIELTWPMGDGHPMRIIEKGAISSPGQEIEIIENGRKVLKQTRTEYTAIGIRPATDAEVRKWRRQ